MPVLEVSVEDMVEDMVEHMVEHMVVGEALIAVIMVQEQVPNVVHAECHAEEVAVVVVCPMLVTVGGLMPRKLRTSMSATEVISTSSGKGEILLASSRHVVCFLCFSSCSGGCCQAFSRRPYLLTAPRGWRTGS